MPMLNVVQDKQTGFKVYFGQFSKMVHEKPYLFIFLMQVKGIFFNEKQKCPAIMLCLTAAMILVLLLESIES
jgi:hypothetical protein